MGGEHRHEPDDAADHEQPADEIFDGDGGQVPARRRRASPSTINATPWNRKMRQWSSIALRTARCISLEILESVTLIRLALSCQRSADVLGFAQVRLRIDALSTPIVRCGRGRRRLKPTRLHRNVGNTASHDEIAFFFLPRLAPRFIETYQFGGCFVFVANSRAARAVALFRPASSPRRRQLAALRPASRAPRPRLRRPRSPRAPWRSPRRRPPRRRDR